MPSRFDEYQAIAAQPKPMTATKLKDWRSRKGWTQREASKAMGVSFKTYKALEQGWRTIQPYHVKLVELLG